MISSNRARIAALLLSTILPATALGQLPHPSEEAEARYAQGIAYYRVGAFAEAITEFKASFELFPRPGALFNIGRAYEQLEDYESAVEYFEKYVALGPPKTQVVAEARARIIALKKKIAEARAEGEKEQTAAKLSAAREALATKPREALSAFREIYQATKDPELLFDMAEALRISGDAQKAELEYQRYLDDAPRGARRVEAQARLEELRSTAPSPTSAKEPGGMIRTEATAADSTKSGVGVLAGGAVDLVAPGAGALLGASFAATESWELSLVAIIAGSFGIRPGASYLFGSGTFRPSVGLSLPVFFDDTVSVGIRAAPGVRIAIADPLSASIELGAEGYFNAPEGFKKFLFVPTAALHLGF